MGGPTRSITSAVRNGDNRIDLPVSRCFGAGDTGTLSYTLGNMTDSQGTALAAFSGLTIVNTVGGTVPYSQVPQASPTLVSCDSEEMIGESGQCSRSRDNDPNTIWHTQWMGSTHLSYDPLIKHTSQTIIENYQINKIGREVIGHARTRVLYGV